MISSANVQIGKALGLPTHAYMGMSDSKIIDAQCGLESMAVILLLPFRGKHHFGLWHAGFESCLSFEKWSRR